VLEAGWHMISLPAQPADADPQEVFKDSNGVPLPISGNLHRWDADAKGYATYWDFAPQQFGNCRTGDGYWLYLFEDTVISYQGTRHIGKQLIECKGANSEWSLIGCPFAEPVPVDDCLVENGDVPIML
jgi:hypothetical protein